MSGIDRLRAIMDRLRGPDGCPWDREQSLENLATFLVEETYEVLDAIAAGTPAALCEELGDLLFQIVFQARLMQEQGHFDLDAVMRGIGDKIVRRHPHVFGDRRLETADQVLAQWEQIKIEERRRARGDGSLFAGVPARLPALLKALRLGAKAARVGFDWPDRRGLLLKVDEEIGELRRALRRPRRARVREEIGDLLFTIANLARHLAIDPEEALQGANRKFVARFREVERGLRARGLQPGAGQRPRMEALWKAAKRRERRLRKTSPGRSGPSGGTSGSAPRRARPAGSA